MVRSVKGGEPHAEEVEADPGALVAVSGEGPDAGASEASDVVESGAAEDAVLEVEPEWAPKAYYWTVEKLIEEGFFEEKLAREHTCVLGRRAVSATHECLGEKCVAWRWGPQCANAERKFGFCGLAGRP